MRSRHRLVRVAILGLLLLAAGAPFLWRRAYVAWQVGKGREYLAAGDAAGALRPLRAAEWAWPDHPETLYLLGRSCRRAGQLAEAEQYLDRAERAGWRKQDVRDQRDLIAVQMGRFDRAEQFLSRVLTQPCDDELAEEVYEARAKGFLFTYRLGDALLCLNYWIEWRPNSVAPRLMRADIWERCERLTQATEEYRGILAVDPRHHIARRSLAQDLLIANSVEEALNEFNVCLKEQPNDFGALLGKAQCSHRLGDLAASEATLRQLLPLKLTVEERAEALVELGKVLLLTQRYEEAIPHLLEAVEADPRNRGVYYVLGMAYTRAGQADAGEPYFERGRRVNEQYVRLAEITRLLVTSPGDAALRCEAGLIFTENGLAEEGAAWLQTALLFDPAHAPTHAALADYYAKSGHPERADYHRARAAELPSEPSAAPQTAASK